MNVSDSSVMLTGLNGSSTYHVSINAITGAGGGPEKSKTFKTPLGKRKKQ